MAEDPTRRQFHDVVAQVLGEVGSGSDLDVRGTKGPFEEIAFSVRGEEVVLMCSQWETIAFVADRIRWEFEALLSRDGREGLADLVRSLAVRGIDRSRRRPTLMLESGERLRG